MFMTRQCICGVKLNSIILNFAFEQYLSYLYYRIRHKYIR